MYFPGIRRHVDPELAGEFQDQIEFLCGLAASLRPSNETEYDASGEVKGTDTTRAASEREADYQKP